MGRRMFARTRAAGRARWAISTSLLLLCGSAVSAQAPAEAPAQAPPGSKPLTLTDCVSISLESQPAIAAAQSSYGAALSAQRGVNNLPFFAGLLSRDLPIRRQQAEWGLNIAAAGVDLAEWETRYAVARNFYSVMYAHAQGKLLDSVVDKLKAARDKTKTFLDDPKVKIAELKVSDLDLKNLDALIAVYEAKRVEATVGLKKAISALREAIGIDTCPLVLVQAPLEMEIPDIDCKRVTALAMERRGELAQVNAALQVSSLEIEAQRRLCLKMLTKTFASASDIHSKPIPQGIAHGEYRPGAIGLEMPVFMVGSRWDRVDRAEQFYGRAGAVADKTTNLVVLDAEIAFLKWEEASGRIKHLRRAREISVEYAKLADKRFQDATGKLAPDELVRARTLEEQTLAQYNEALYLHVLALAGLE